MPIKYTLDKVGISSRLQKERIRAGHTQESLAEAMRITNKYISKVENGAADPPLSYVMKFSDITRTNVCYLLRGIKAKTDVTAASMVMEATAPYGKLLHNPEKWNGCSASSVRILQNPFQGLFIKQTKRYDKEEHWLLDRGYDKDSIREYINEEADDQYSSKSSAQQSLGYFIAYKDFFSTWIHMGADFSVDNVRTGLSSFNRLISESHKKVFKESLRFLHTGFVIYKRMSFYSSLYVYFFNSSHSGPSCRLPSLLPTKVLPFL